MSYVCYIAFEILVYLILVIEKSDKFQTTFFHSKSRMFPSLKMLLQSMVIIIIFNDKISSSTTLLPSQQMETKLSCSELPITMVVCTYNTTSCVYGELVRVYCIPLIGVKCVNDKLVGGIPTKANRSVEIWNRSGHYRMAICRFCHQVNLPII